MNFSNQVPGVIIIKEEQQVKQQNLTVFICLFV